MIDKTLVYLWQHWKSLLLTLLWISLSLVAIMYSVDLLFGKDQRRALSGKTSDGHYQFEVACNACHTPFNGVSQQTCLHCHGEKLKAAKDSHASKKLSNPRNAEQLTKIDARLCITCHAEHQAHPSNTSTITIAADFCQHCHQTIAAERPSHKGLTFNKCRSCHNYHDNTALNEGFLAKHLDEPNLLDDPVLPARNFLYFYHTKNKPPKPVVIAPQHTPDFINMSNAQNWIGSSHAQAGVNCENCHSKAGKEWARKPNARYCKGCHKSEVNGFLAGKHGIRLAQNLSAMSTDKARQTMQIDSIKSLSCASCHYDHRFNTAVAAVEACLGCHQDDHSRAYKASPHFRLWRDEQQGTGKKNSGVSCASCHLPREAPKTRNTGNEKPKRTQVQHNPSHNLHPNQKMLQDVCLRCHGLGFSLNALADKDIIRDNFAESSKKQLSNLNMVKQRINQ